MLSGPSILSNLSYPWVMSVLSGKIWPVRSICKMHVHVYLQEAIRCYFQAYHIYPWCCLFLVPPQLQPDFLSYDHNLASTIIDRKSTPRLQIIPSEICGISSRSMFFYRRRKRLWHFCTAYTVHFYAPDYKVVLRITHSNQDEIEEPIVALKITPIVGWVSDSYVSPLLLPDTWDRTTTSSPLDIFPLCCIKEIHEVTFLCRP